MHPLTKIIPDDPEVLVLDVIEVQPGATALAWRTRTSTEWEARNAHSAFRLDLHPGIRDYGVIGFRVVGGGGVRTPALPGRGQVPPCRRLR